jgi:hypothetical protein
MIINRLFKHYTVRGPIFVLRQQLSLHLFVRSYAIYINTCLVYYELIRVLF